MERPNAKTHYQQLYSSDGPQTYCPSDGARFEVHFTKSRSVYGEAARPFEAQLLLEEGFLTWRIGEITSEKIERIEETERLIGCVPIAVEIRFWRRPPRDRLIDPICYAASLASSRSSL